MNKLQDHTTSLELSKKLKELGLKQESYFVWEYYDDQCYGIKYIPYAVVPSELNQFQWFSAYLASELMEIIPQRVFLEMEYPFDSYIFNMQIVYLYLSDQLERCYIVNYICDTCLANDFDKELPLISKKLTKNFYNPNCADSMAELLIYLIENNLVSDEWRKEWLDENI